MREGRRWSGGVLGLLVLGSCLVGVLGHVQLSFPPPTLKLDFLDNARTGGICGHAASGSDNSGLWRLPEPNEDTVTDLIAGENVSVEWDLHYAHQGGFRFELYDADLNMVSTWNDSSHWGCSHDGTQQSVNLRMPTKTCEGCILRLQRQALEWGANYLFHSCAQVNVVEGTNKDEDKCLGCSGHGECNKGKCECDSSEEKGFWYGKYCERQNECEEDSHCGTEGLCIDTEALTAPAKQCYCKKGFFGKEVTRGTNVADFISTRDCSIESTLELGNPEDWETEYPNSLKAGDTMTVYYKVDEEKGEIEYAVTAKTTSYVAWGLRAAGVKGGKTKKKDKEKEKDEDTESGGEPVTSGEPSGKRKLLSRMPELDMEAHNLQRSLLQGKEKESDKDYDEEDGKKKDESAEGEGEGEAEGEGESEGEGSGTNLGCDPGEPSTVKLDKGMHFKKPVDVGASLGGDGYGSGDSEGEGEADAEAEGGAAGKETEKEEEEEGSKQDGRRGRKLFRMPVLDSEVSDQPVLVGRKVLEDSDDGEPEAEAEAGAEGETGPVTEVTKTYFAEGTKCENLLVDSPNAHLMINQDIIIAYAKGDAIRVQDTFTPSRARPSPDIFFGGEDDILDAVGEETKDGFTNVKVRRKLETKDKVDYCILKDINYVVIYAIGQGSESTHIPDSSLETGRSSNKNFYREDELKFHGGGIGSGFSGRGSFGIVNFFEESAAEGSCVTSSLEDFDCMSDEIGGRFQLHWKKEEDGVKFGAQSQGSGWISIAFPDNPGVMVEADAVIGWVDGGDATVGVFKLEGRDSNSITADNDAFKITDESVESDDESTLLTFTRNFDDSFTGDEAVDVLVAFHATDGPGFAYHATDRAAAVVDLGGGGSAGSEQGCTESEAEGFDCVSTELDGGMVVNWKAEETGVKISLEVEGEGYVAMAWPETPGQMVGATAVIGRIIDGEPDIGVFDMTAKSAEGIVPSENFKINDEELVQKDGKTILTFTREYDEGANRRRSLLFNGESGPMDLLFAYHDTEPTFAYHKSRGNNELNLQSTPTNLALVEADRDSSEESELGDEENSELLQRGGGDISGCVPSDLVDEFECMQASDDGSFILHWTATEEEVKIGAQATEAGYVSVGFPSTPGEMIGSKAVIGWAGDENSVDLYTLDSKQVPGIVVEANAIPVVGDPAVEEIDGTTLVSFTRAFDDDFPYTANHDLVYAFHTADAIEYHFTNRGSLNINFGTGASSASQGEDLTKYWNAHGWLMVISWGGLLPIGIIIARTLKDKGPTWFYLHLVCQVGGFAIAIAGWVIAMVKFEPEDGFRHGRVGLAVMILGFTQASAFLRPHPGAKFRHEWEWLHWSVGRVALILGIYNIFTGLDRYDELNMVGQKYHVNYGMFLMSLFVVYLNLEARAQRIKGEKMQSELNARMKGVEAGSSPTSQAPMDTQSAMQPDLHHRTGVVNV